MNNLQTYPTLEETLDTFSIPRSIRVSVEPDVLAQVTSHPQPLICAECGNANDWLWWQSKGKLICGCRL